MNAKTVMSETSRNTDEEGLPAGQWVRRGLREEGKVRNSATEAMGAVVTLVL